MPEAWGHRGYPLQPEEILTVRFLRDEKAQEAGRGESVAEEAGLGFQSW